MPDTEDPFAHIKVTESHDSRATSRTSDDAQCRQFFSVSGAYSSGEAEARIRLQAPPPEVTYSADMSIDVQPVFYDRQNPQNNIFEITRSYSKRHNEIDDENGLHWTISASSNTVTCTEARRAIAADGSYPLWNWTDEESENYNPDGIGTPINVKKTNGKLEAGGIEIVVPTLTLKLSFEVTAEEFVLLRPGILRKVGMVNSEPWLSWDTEELLFESFDISNQTEEMISINYSFAVSPSSDYIAGDFTITNAPGFAVKHSVWLEEEEVVNPDGTKQSRPKCSGAYASSVYLRMMFKSLLPPRLQG